MIPASAHAKITCRLVPGQEPAASPPRSSAHLRQRCPAGSRLEIAGERRACCARLRDRARQSRACCCRGRFGGALRPPALARGDGRHLAGRGAVPASARLDTVFFSFATADEDYHAPNEFFRLGSFRDGLTAWARLLPRLGWHWRITGSSDRCHRLRAFAHRQLQAAGEVLVGHRYDPPRNRLARAASPRAIACVSSRWSGSPRSKAPG